MRMRKVSTGKEFEEPTVIGSMNDSSDVPGIDTLLDTSTMDPSDMLEEAPGIDEEDQGIQDPPNSTDPAVLLEMSRDPSETVLRQRPGASVSSEAWS